ncbi:hypothetical protein bas01_0067 [Escherichia phage AugustePiccard]|uniref:Uncharacterized protein n=1 Tax=Escherichia phage AugustePiccard TaxID=2851954 RepID=A0AAE8AYT9_9CAUD|nr:hypothetical protein bas01_0067 [Escherichia phage AugustePiccard]
MDRVVSYDYFIDNKEEMKMKNVIIEDIHFDQAEVGIAKSVRGNVVYLNFDPDNYGDGQTLMQYSPEQARKLAAALIMAADEAEKQR